MCGEDALRKALSYTQEAEGWSAHLVLPRRCLPSPRLRFLLRLEADPGGKSKLTAGRCLF